MARGRASNYDAQREAILQHAAALFARSGYPATSMNQVAEACGLSKATLYHYYRDKDAMLVAIAEGHVLRLRAQDAQGLEGRHADHRFTLKARPEPPLLLCDRVLSTTVKPGVLERGQTMFTATDVRDGAWYLHEGRVPAGILIESGQADLLLISMMGVDFENAGARSYRLLGCDLTYTEHLPVVGDVLHHSIVIDGFATAAISAESEARIFFFHSDTRIGDENEDQD